MATRKVTVSFSKNSANPDFNSEVLFIQGKRVEINKEVSVEVDPIIKEIIEESNNRYTKFATSKDKITPDQGVRTTI